jgi:hypothetical protein
VSWWPRKEGREPGVRQQPGLLAKDARRAVAVDTVTAELCDIFSREL